MKDHACDHDQTLISAVKDLIANDKRPILDIAMATETPYHWLVQLRCGNIKQPSVNRIQWIYEKLTGKTIQL